MKGLFIPDITVEMFRNGCLEGIEELMAVGEIYDIEYEPELNWIPCSERLPEDDIEVLVTVANSSGKRYVEQGSCISGTWCLAYDHLRLAQDARVIAWMPLPEPYKDGDEDEN